jgi:TrmH family RNA methyltransferase
MLFDVQHLYREKQQRDGEGLFVVEGSKIIRDIVNKGCLLKYVIVASDFGKMDWAMEFFSDINIDVFYASCEDYARLTSLKTPEGIIAVARKSKFHEISYESSKSLAVLCDAVQDPGNLGSIFRAAAAFNADFILLSDGTADVYNPGVVRASCGTVLDVPSYHRGQDTLQRLKKSGYTVFAADLNADGSTAIDRINDIPPLSMVVFGNEGHGLSDDVKCHADVFFHIPINEKVESLNVVSAVAISLYVFGKGRVKNKQDPR